MSRRLKKEGICKLCGSYGQLSYEHVPPKAAFNNGNNYYQATLDQLTKIDAYEFDFRTHSSLPLEMFEKKQGGVGYFSLCVKCNNTTGLWYASDFVNWASQAMTILLKANGKPTLHYPTFFFPLRVIKQVVTMFFSICHDGLRNSESELQSFVLNRDRTHLSEKYKIYCYYNFKGGLRYMGDNVIGSLTDTNIIRASELSFPPFGFVLTIDSVKPDERLTDITRFARFPYYERHDYYQKFNVLPTFLPHIPLDYRSKEEIEAAVIEEKLRQVKKSSSI